jgi:hypothetical protein
MVWVKRNLVFVIIIAVGLIATGYCGYLLYKVLGANAGVSSDYSSTLQELQAAQQVTPPATKENIQAAKADQERVRQFLGDFRKSFAPFPIAPKVDDRGFVEHLQLTLRRFAAAATNAGVQLPADYAFSFSQQRQKVSFASECIGPWMQELEDINLILRILFEAKINYLEQIQRVPACADDNYGDDCLYTSAVSNQWGVVTPYKVTFRGFSTEVASVLAGFADSSNCFLVKYVNVTPSKAPLPPVVMPQQQQQQQRYMPATDYNPYMGDDGDRPGRGTRGRSMQRQQGPVLMGAPAAPTPPETILQETPLYITIVVDAVQLKTTEH